MSMLPGFKSLLTPERDEGNSVWSVAFENLDAGRLERDHKQMLQQLYGIDS
jgi:hypothetical protein